jgi:hypothetical protein
MSTFVRLGHSPRVASLAAALAVVAAAVTIPALVSEQTQGCEADEALAFSA